LRDASTATVLIPGEVVSILDGRQAALRVRTHLDPDIAHMVFDGCELRPLPKTTVRPLRRVVLVTNRNVREARGKQLRLDVTSGRRSFTHDRYHVFQGPIPSPVLFQKQLLFKIFL
jgi:hypothetical protein